MGDGEPGREDRRAARVVADQPHADARRFDFVNIAETLGEFICAAPHDAPFNICLGGGWGSGKTTLLRKLRDGLPGAAEDEEDADEQGARTQYVPIWFEPWKLDGEVEVRNVLAHRVLQAIATTPASSRTPRSTSTAEASCACWHSASST